MPILTVTAVSKELDGRKVVDNISFAQETGEKIAIAGETGSGKSCLLKMIGGILKADEGVIRFEDEKVWAPPDKLLPGHPGIVYLSQHFELRNNYYVHEMLSYSNKLSNEESKKLYEVCQIEYLLHRKTNSGLSGGERQRIALAMLLATKPRLLLLDEPFSNLDIMHKQIIRKVVQDISTISNCSIIMVSHDPLDILSWADTVMLMENGKMLQKGTAIEVYTNPVNEYAAGLLGNFNLIKPFDQILFSGSNMDETKAGTLFLRPESIFIYKQQQDEINQPGATIQQITYFGMYYMIDVEIENVFIKIYTMDDDFRIGEQVRIGLKSSAAWKLPEA